MNEIATGSCVIRVTSLSISRPEFFNFRAGVWVGKSGNGQLFTGFTLDVGNLIYENGRPVKTTRTSISTASFSSSDFDSRGVMYDVDMGDGGRAQMTADPAVGVKFLGALHAGNYAIAFSARGVDRAVITSLLGHRQKFSRTFRTAQLSCLRG